MENNHLQVNKITAQIRDFVNNSVIQKARMFSKKQEGAWNQFFAALDTIEDTCLAIQSFQEDSGDCFSKNPYLTTYGILQVLYTQQDAVNFLKTSLFGSTVKIDFKSSKYSELKKTRDIRGETIGHPVRSEKKGKESKYHNDEITSCTIDRLSLTKDGFEYMLWMHSKTEKKSVSFPNLVSQQDSYLSVELQLLLKTLQKQEKEHKSKFEGEKLSDLLSAKSIYEVNLIYGVQRKHHLAWPSFDYFHRQYKKIKKGIEARYEGFGKSFAIPGTEVIIEELDDIFFRLEKFKEVKKINTKDFEFYVDALDKTLKELERHLEEIDREFIL
jgi:hypothetical protein